MIYFPLFCLIITCVLSQYCEVPGCQICESNNPQKCEQCFPVYQKNNFKCQLILDSQSTSALKDEDFLDPGNIQANTINTLDIPGTLIQKSVTDDQQIGKLSMNYAISKDLHFHNHGNQRQQIACLFANRQNICIVCHQNYVMRPGNICVPRTKKCRTIKFDRKHGPAQCLQCQPKFKLTNHGCIDTGCQIQNYYTCAKCKPGYYMTIHGVCFDPFCTANIDGICQLCFQGYYVDLLSGRCVRNILLTQSKKQDQKFLGNDIVQSEEIGQINNVGENLGQNLENRNQNNGILILNNNNINTINNQSFQNNNNPVRQDQMNGQQNFQQINNNIISNTISSNNAFNNTIYTQITQTDTFNSDNSSNTLNNMSSSTQNNNNIPQKTQTNIFNNDSTSIENTQNNINQNSSNIQLETENQINNNTTMVIDNNNGSQLNQRNSGVNNQSLIIDTIIYNTSQPQQNTNIQTNTGSMSNNINNNQTNIGNRLQINTSNQSMSANNQMNQSFINSSNTSQASNSSLSFNSLQPINNINFDNSTLNNTSNQTNTQNINIINTEQSTDNSLSKNNITTMNSQNMLNDFVFPSNCLRISTNIPYRCIQCRSGFYLSNINKISDSNNYCRKNSRFCIQQNQNGQCLTCINSTSLVQGSCIDTNCEIFIDQIQSRSALQTDDRYCHQCKQGYFINQQIGSVCSVIFKDPNCLDIHINVCLQCKIGYFIDTDGYCEQIPENCYDKDCLYCQQGYASVNNQCIKIENCDLINDTFCKVCSNGYKLTKVGTCIIKINFCLEYDFFGCSKCSVNSILTEDKKCSINRNYNDPFCQIKDGRNRCIKCSKGYYVYNQTFLCEPVNGFCRTYNQANGQCTSCYTGYFLNQISGECVQKKPIQNCAQQSGNICLKCSNRYYLFSSTQCRQVNKLCQTYDIQFGYCLTCYQGYSQYNGQCLLDGEIQAIQNSNQVNDNMERSIRIVQPVEQQDIVYAQKIQEIYCKIINPQDQTRCLECFNTFYLNLTTGKCLRANPVCRTYNNSTGECLTCYNGYQLIQSNNLKICAPFDLSTYSSPTEVPSLKIIQNLVCANRNQSSKACLSCPPRYYLNNGICVQVLPECKLYSQITGQCFQCYSPYKPSIKQPQVCELSISQVQIPFCDEYNMNSKNQIMCQNCLSGYYLKEGVCVAFSILCKIFDEQNQECEQCISGYVLFKSEMEQNECIQPVYFDQNCLEYGRNGFCVMCKEQYKSINGICSLF